jgi:hypothetical protein
MLVRLQCETEGAPYTGLKPAGTTKAIIKMSDNALNSDDINKLTEKLNTHIGNIAWSKYEKAASLSKIKDESTETGRQFVKAYVDYTHTLEVSHDIQEHGVASHSGH